MIWDNTNRCIEGISLVWRSFGDESIAGGAIGMDEPKKLYQPFWCELEGTKILVSGKLRGYYGKIIHYHHFYWVGWPISGNRRKKGHFWLSHYSLEDSGNLTVLAFAMFGPSSRSKPRSEQTFLRASSLFIVNLVEYLFFLLGKMGSLP